METALTSFTGESRISDAELLAGSRSLSLSGTGALPSTLNSDNNVLIVGRSNGEYIAEMRRVVWDSGRTIYFDIPLSFRYDNFEDLGGVYPISEGDSLFNAISKQTFKSPGVWSTYEINDGDVSYTPFSGGRLTGERTPRYLYPKNQSFNARINNFDIIDPDIMFLGLSRPLSRIDDTLSTNMSRYGNLALPGFLLLLREVK